MKTTFIPVINHTTTPTGIIAAYLANSPLDAEVFLEGDTLEVRPCSGNIYDMTDQMHEALRNLDPLMDALTYGETPTEIHIEQL